MNEETLNQELENDDWDLPEIADDKLAEITTDEEEKPADSKEEETNNTKEETKTEEETNNTKEETKTEEKTFTLKTKFNGEERELTEEEAREYAQKGMNYDKVLGRYNDLTSQLEAIASSTGMDVNSFIGSLRDNQIEFEVSKEKEVLNKKYPDIENKEVIEELARKNVMERLNTNYSKFVQQKEVQLSNEEIKIKNDIARFRQEYPDLEIDKLDKSVYDNVKKGYGLLEAYQKFKIDTMAKEKAEADKQAEIEKQNASNKARSLGDTSNVGGAKTKDYFMEGWDSID